MAKKRVPICEVLEHEGRTLVYEVHLPAWKNRDLLVAVDEARGFGGRLVSEVAEVFDDAWLKLQPDAAHEVARAMCWRMDPSVRFLADVGELILVSRAGGPGRGDLITRMQQADEFDGALCEARVARLIHEQGIPFAFNVQAHEKAHDINALGAQHLAIEVKSLQTSLRDSLESSLTSAVTMASRVDGFDIVFDWSGDRVAKIDVRNIDQGEFYRIADEAIRVLAHATERGVGVYDVPEIGWMELTVAEFPEMSCFAQTGDHARMFDRALRTWRKALKQLPPSTPGLIVLSGNRDVFDPQDLVERFGDFFERQGGDYPLVVGMVVLVCRSNYDAIYEDVLPVHNPGSTVLGEAGSWPLLGAPGLRVRGR